jgi:hypothetical protein
MYLRHEIFLTLRPVRQLDQGTAFYRRRGCPVLATLQKDGSGQLQSEMQQLQALRCSISGCWPPAHVSPLFACQALKIENNRSNMWSNIANSEQGVK